MFPLPLLHELPSLSDRGFCSNGLTTSQVSFEMAWLVLLGLQTYVL